MSKAKKVVSAVLAGVMASAMVAGCGQSSGGSDSSTAASSSAAAATETATEAAETADAGEGAAKYPEFITVDVFDSQANYQGIQSGWFAKIVKDKFNMELNIIAPNVAGGGDTLFQTRSANGNLGDLILTNANKGRLQDLVTAVI